MDGQERRVESTCIVESGRFLGTLICCKKEIIEENVGTGVSEIEIGRRKN